MKDGGRSRRVIAGVAAAYLVLGVFYTWPLARDGWSQIAVATGDPELNATILWWNAVHLPFSSGWWNALPYYPSEGVAAFTENLAGVSVFASPAYWLTGNAIAAYNVALFVTWPLSAFTMYLLVWYITRRHDAAFVAGLAYGFSTYRTAELGHVQMLSSHWMPLCLLGLHGFVAERRRRWLALFGIAWLLQSLSNGHFMFFGAVLIGLWLLYFCSTAARWRSAMPIVLAWTIASLPLLPILYRYWTVHESYGLHRSLSEILAFSARPHSWVEVSDDDWFWFGTGLLHPGRDDLFPGLAAVALVAIAAFALLVRPRPDLPTIGPRHRRLRMWLGALAAIALAATIFTLIVGPWSVTIAGTLVRMSRLSRALGLALLCGVPILLMTPRTRGPLMRRSPFVFYAAAVPVIALLCCGPVLRVGPLADEGVVMSPAPYHWLMALPGFMELRVPLRFWMFGTLCLASAAGLGYRALRPAGASSGATFVLVSSMCLVDGWMPTMRMATPGASWMLVEPPNRPEPILELPIGPAWDWSATFRTVYHGRRVVNGLSGYNSPHYIALENALQDRDPAALAALTSLGALDVVVIRAADPDGAIARYVAASPGAVLTADDGAHTLFRLARSPPEPDLGPPLPIVRIEAFDQDPGPAYDGKIDTGWGANPQAPGQWLIVDLGSVRTVGGVTNAIGEYFLDYPRRLVIEVSEAGTVWERVWEGPTAANTFLASVRAPRETLLRFAFPPRPARFVRLVQLERSKTMWRVSELQVHAPR